MASRTNLMQTTLVVASVSWNSSKNQSTTFLWPMVHICTFLVMPNTIFYASPYYKWNLVCG